MAKRNRDESLDKADAIRDEFVKEFYPEWNSGSPGQENQYGITGTGLGGDTYDCKTSAYYPTVRVYVLSEAGKALLTAELQKRDSSHDFLYFEGAEIDIVVTGQIVAL